MSVPLARRQLFAQPGRLVVALLGVAFAVMLMLMQLGFRSAMTESAVRYQERLEYDLVLLSPGTVFVGLTRPFSQRRLLQAASDPGVAAVTPVRMYPQHFENPTTHRSRNLLVVGIDPERPVLRTPGFAEGAALLKRPDVVLFDEDSRPEFGRVAERFRDEGPVTTDVGSRRVEVVGLFRLGSSFGIDGNVVTSDINFFRIFPQRPRGAIDLGLLHLHRGADVEQVRERLLARLPGDVEVHTRRSWIEREIAYWEGTTPIGTVFGFGLAMGLLVGGVIVYQILYANITEALRQFATLKAMGFSDSWLAFVVLRQALMLALLGFLPGAGLAVAGYAFASRAIRMPLELTAGRVAGVLFLTVAMCAGAALVVVRRLADADPADTF